MKWKFFFRALAEDIPFDEIVDELKDFDQRFVLILRKHLAVLSWWCFITTILSIIGLIWGSEKWMGFFTMHIVWAIINFGIVLFIFDHMYFQGFRKGGVVKRLEIQRHVEKMMFLNVGLDLAYFFCGLFFLMLSYKPEITYPDLWFGFGLAVMIQGVFLFTLDNVFHTFHTKNYRQSKPFIESLVKSRLNETKID